MINVMDRNVVGRRNFLRLAGIGGVVAGGMTASRIARAAERNDHAPGVPANEKTLQLTLVLRDRWVGHIFWLRGVSLAVIESNDAAMEVAELQAAANADSIAASIEPYYGTAAKEAFAGLLADHYKWVKTYLAATVSSNPSMQATATQSLASNAEEIAEFLSEANPHLLKDELQSLLLAHGGHHIQQIQQIWAGNFASEAETWAGMKAHVYRIADVTAEALTKQFPGIVPTGLSG